MFRRQTWKVLAFCVPIVIFSQNIFGYLNEQEMGYDRIINELSVKKVRHPSPRDPLDDVRIHGGLSLIHSQLNIRNFRGQNWTQFQNGLQVRLGIDLLSENWIAEGTVRSFETEQHHQISVGLKEFDLRLIYHYTTRNFLNLHLGCGLAARYLTLHNSKETIRYSTPASIVLIGLSTPLGSRFTLGADMGYRSSLISETIDRNSFNLEMGLMSHF